ncbi:MAG TPA: GNAT family N-acetyltransferase [Anaerolineae bacterium]|nr:GNAT family N-acetyltransferase [Anaerolineae bacterium]
MQAESYVLRLFQPKRTEYEEIVRVYNVGHPEEPASAEVWQHWDAHRSPDSNFQRYVVTLAGKIGGYGYSLRTEPGADKFRFGIFLLPEWETADLIARFYDYVMGCCLALKPTALKPTALKPTVLICQIVEGEERKRAWLEANGFQIVMRYPLSRLDVDRFDETQYERLWQEVAAEGIEVVDLVELAERDADWQRKVYELDMLLSSDVPRPTVFKPSTFEQYAGHMFGASTFVPKGWWVALDGDKYVGMTALFKLGDGFKRLETGLTGVRQAYRRRGIAMVLKSRSIAWAQGVGAKSIQTSNEENNPMFQINLQLGFEEQPAEIDWEKEV